MKSDRGKPRLKPLGKVSFRSSRKKKKEEGLRRSTQKISETNCTYKNQRRPLESKRGKSKKREKGLSRSY
jgi:hypothetical protein